MQRIIEVFNKCVVCGCETNGMYGDEYPVCFGCYRSGRLLEWQSTQQSVHPTVATVAPLEVESKNRNSG